MTIIYHITSRAEWEAAQRAGDYRTPSLESEGFIHNSTADQAPRVANAVFAGQQGLILLCVETDKLTAPLKYEPPVHVAAGTPKTREGELFPHIFGPLNLDAVVDVVDFPPNADGMFTMPAGLS